MKKILHVNVIEHGVKYLYNNYRELNDVEITCPECDAKTKNVNEDFNRHFMVMFRIHESRGLFSSGYVYLLKCLSCNCKFEIYI